MSKFVIQNADGKFLKGGTSMYSNISWVESLEKARVFNRMCDASNCITARKENRRWWSQTEKLVRDELNIREVKLALVGEGSMS